MAARCAWLVALLAVRASAQHVLHVVDNDDVTWEDVRGAFAKLGVREAPALAVVEVLNKRGEALVLEGSKKRCEKGAELFGALGMRARVLDAPAPPPGAPYAGSAVTVLTADTFPAVVSSGTPMIINAYAPWCGHCKRLTPAYRQAARVARWLAPGARLVAIDCDGEPQLCQMLGVRGYPTMLRAAGGRIVGEYSGARSAVAMAIYATTQSTMAFIGRALRAGGLRVPGLRRLLR